MTSNRNISVTNASNSDNPDLSPNMRNAFHKPTFCGIEGHDKFSTIHPVQETKP